MQNKFKFENSKQKGLIRVYYLVDTKYVKIAHYTADDDKVSLLDSTGITGAISDIPKFKETIKSLVNTWIFENSIFGKMSDEEFKSWQESLYITLVGVEIAKSALSEMSKAHPSLADGTVEISNLINAADKLKLSLVGTNGVIPPSVEDTIQSIIIKVKEDAKSNFCSSK